MFYFVVSNDETLLEDMINAREVNFLFYVTFG